MTPFSGFELRSTHIQSTDSMPANATAHKMFSMIFRASFSLSEEGSNAGTAETMYTRYKGVSATTLARGLGTHLALEAQQPVPPS